MPSFFGNYWNIWFIKMKVNQTMKKLRRRRIQDTGTVKGILRTMEIGDSKENVQRDFRMLAMYQAGVDPGFMEPEAYTIRGSSLRK